TTVTQSYEQLLSEGYLQAALGSGTFVCRQLPDDLLRPAPGASGLRAAGAVRRPVRLSSYGESLADSELFEPLEPEPPINFGHWRPALDAFPLRQWRRLLFRHSRFSHQGMLDYSAH